MSEERQKANDVLALLEDLDPQDNIEQLEKAMHYFCGLYDIGEGYKHAIELTVNDQSNNHEGENELSDYDELLKILNSNQ